MRPMGVGELFMEEQAGTGEDKNNEAGGGKERERERERERQKERDMLGRKRGRETDQVPLCKACWIEVQGEDGLGGDDDEEKSGDLEKVVVKKGLERIDKVDGGLTRRRWEMREGEKERDKEKRLEKEKEKVGKGGKGGLQPLRRGAVDDRSLARNEMAMSSGSEEPETIYVNIFDPVGREAFKPSLMKPIPEWMQSGAQEHLERKTRTALTVKPDLDKPKESTSEHVSTNSTPRPIRQDGLSQGLSETSSSAAVIQTSPQPPPSRASNRRRSGVSPRATSPVPSIDAISRPSSVLGRRTPNLRTGTSFVSEQPLVVPSMSSSLPKDTARGSTKDSTRDSWLSNNSSGSHNQLGPSYSRLPESPTRPSSVRSVATIFERGIASKDQRHTPVNQPLPLLRVLQQPYLPLNPTRSDTSLSSSSKNLQPNPATQPQRAQTHELGAANLPKAIQNLRSGQASPSSINRMGSATVSPPVVPTSSEYLERYQPVKASLAGTRTSVRTSVRTGGHGPGVGEIAREWEGQLSGNTSSSEETERDLLANRVSAYSTSQPPVTSLRDSHQGAKRTSIGRTVWHSTRREGAHDEGTAPSPPAEPYPNIQTTIHRSVSQSVRREGAHDQSQGQSYHSMSQPQSPKPQSPTLQARALPFSAPSSPPKSSPNSQNRSPSGPSGPTAPIPLNFTVQRRLVKRPSIKGGPTAGSVATERNTPSTSTTKSSTWASSAESPPGTSEEKKNVSFRGRWAAARGHSAGDGAVEDSNSTSGSGSGTSVMPPPPRPPGKTLSKRKSVQVELKRLFGR